MEIRNLIAAWAMRKNLANRRKILTGQASLIIGVPTLVLGIWRFAQTALMAPIDRQFLLTMTCIGVGTLFTVAGYQRIKIRIAAEPHPQLQVPTDLVSLLVDANSLPSNTKVFIKKKYNVSGELNFWTLYALDDELATGFQKYTNQPSRWNRGL